MASSTPQSYSSGAEPVWPRLAVQILLGTGMRCGELAALSVSDFEDDGEVGFIKVRKGKGAKFRRVPLSSRLRREVGRYLNRFRQDSEVEQMLLRSDGEPVAMMTVEHLLRRIKARVGFKVHAHKFRHTFATEYRATAATLNVYVGSSGTRTMPW